MYYFIVWEIYSDEWILKGKGHDFFWIKDTSNIDEHIQKYVNSTAEAHGVSSEYCVITNLKLIDERD